MRRVGQARRRDAVEGPIISAGRLVGADVTPISGKGAPDVLVRFRGRLFAFEVKSGKGRRTKAQTVSEWPIVRTPLEFLEAIGANASDLRW